MKLIGSYTSPFVRKIFVLLLEKQLTFEFVSDNPYLDDARVLAVNPLGKVPALIADDGEIVFDSPLVAEYLDALTAAPRFLPQDRTEALRVRQVEALADGICDAAVTIVRELRRPAERQDSTELQRQRAKIQRGLDALERQVAERRWLNGPELNLADIATGCCLSYLNFRRVYPNWCVGRPALVCLAERLFQRDSFLRTVPPAD
ncbi:glutathione S-transferase [Edwardsiella tarda]|uniref:glutathione S-transferase n=1 Tax=Edwardsiella tarda TaxID=636 RepID=UPI00351C30D5